MLTLTQNATDAIHDLVEDRPRAGLRIFRSPSANGGEAEFALSVADSPHSSDEVVEQDGCFVFLDEAVAGLVDGQILDAHAVDGQVVSFDFVS